MQKQTSKFLSFFYSRWFIILSLALIVLLLLSYNREIQRQKKINEKILELRNEALTLEQSNFKLARMLNYVQSEEFVELEARKNLNYKKPGEKVIVITENNNNEGGTKKAEQLSNWEKWLYYFFTE